MSLTDRQCRGFAPTDKMQKFADKNGLNLVVMPTGRKVWRGRYRVNGKEQTKTLGEYPTVSLAQAREAWRVFRSTPQAQAKALTFRQVFEKIPEWDERHGKKPARISSKVLECIPDWLYDKPVDQIHRRELAVLLEQIQQSSEFKTRPFVAKKVIAKVLGIAQDLGYIEVNPSLQLSRVIGKLWYIPRLSLPIDQLGWYVSQVHHPINYVETRYQWLIKLGLLTALRINELVTLKWSDIDFDNATLTVPAERMKMKRDHIVPLSTQALAILKELKQTCVFDLVFMSARTMSSINKSQITKIHKRIGAFGKHTFHGNRAAFATVAQEELGYSFDIVRVQLAHIPPGTTRQAYDRALYVKQRKKLMQEWANWLDRETRKAPNSVGGLLYPIQAP